VKSISGLRFSRTGGPAGRPPKFAQPTWICRHKDLISRWLRRKSVFFDPFLTRKGFDFSLVTKDLPDFLIFKKRRGKPRAVTEGQKHCQPQMARMAQIGMVAEVDSDGEAWEKSELNRIANIIYMNRAIMVLLVSLSVFLTGCATPDVKFSDLSPTTATVSNNAVTIHLGSDNLCSECWIRPKAKVVDQTVYVVGYRTFFHERSREFVVKLRAAVDWRSVSVVWADPDGSHVPIPITK
jgi:hypothetical protein